MQLDHHKTTLIAVAALTLGSACRRDAPTSDGEPSNMPAQVHAKPPPSATVAGKEIPGRAIDELYELQLARHPGRRRALSPTETRQVRQAVVDRLVYEEILEIEAAANQVAHDPDRLEEIMTQQRFAVGNWTTWLRQRGETETTLRAQHIASLHEAALLDPEDVAVTPAEVEAEYRRLYATQKRDNPSRRIWHILVAIRPPDVDGANAPDQATWAQWDERARKRARELRAQAMKPGANFSALARQHSDSLTSIAGGDMGLREAGHHMKPAFRDAAFAVGPGEVSPPVRTPDGYHIIKAGPIYPAGVLPLEALEPRIREDLISRKTRDATTALRRRLLAKYGVATQGTAR